MRARLPTPRDAAPGPGARLQERGNDFRPHAELRGEMERASLAGLAVDPDPALHHGHEARADRQAQSGAPVDSRRGSIRLLERGEDRRLLVGVDADSSVADQEVAPSLQALAKLPFDLNLHPAAVAELYSVADQIEDDL